MKKDYSRGMDLVCSTCGAKDFEYESDEGPFTCTSCERVYATSDELIRENGGRIDRAVDRMGEEIVKDIQKDLHDIFKKFK
jgi:hypothetical protein